MAWHQSSGRIVKEGDVIRLHPRLPRISAGDLVLRQTSQGWHVEDAGGRQICEPLTTMAEARLIGRTFVLGQGRVWVRTTDGWSVLDGD